MIVASDLTHKIIGYAMDVHTKLGPGLLERTYKECLYYKIYQSGHNVEKEKALPLIFEDVKLECGYRIDLLVDNQIVLEIKSVDTLNEIHVAQVLTYMKLGDYKIGLLLNFNVLHLKSGMRRLVNGRL